MRPKPVYDKKKGKRAGGNKGMRAGIRETHHKGWGIREGNLVSQSEYEYFVHLTILKAFTFCIYIIMESVSVRP